MRRRPKQKLIMGNRPYNQTIDYKDIPISRRFGKWFTCNSLERTREVTVNTRLATVDAPIRDPDNPPRRFFGRYKGRRLLMTKAIVR